MKWMDVLEARINKQLGRGGAVVLGAFVAYLGAYNLVWAVDVIALPFATLPQAQMLGALATLVLAPPITYIALRLVFGATSSR